jgi:DNA-binding beta-propeller fold protein YncE
MTITRALVIVYLTAATVMWPLGSIAAETTQYAITGHIAGTGGSWDYAMIDDHGGRLYLAQAGVTAVDLKTNVITTGLVTANISHGLALLGDGTIAVDDSETKVITVFDGLSGRILSRIPTAQFNPVSGMHALDALVFEPVTGMLIAVNGESGLLLLVDINTSRVAGTISVGGHPEFAVADGAGKLFINVNRAKSSEIAVVDIGARKLAKHMRLHGCDGATGLVYDKAEGLVLTVCDNGFLKVLDVQSGRLVASIPVGRGADAVMFDSKRRRAFVPSGDSGTLSVIAVRSATDIALVQTLTTQTGTRLGAVDIDTGRVYLPSAKFGPPTPPRHYPSVRPGSFEFLVVGPN